jgi:hypothetical protein
MDDVNVIGRKLNDFHVGLLRKIQKLDHNINKIYLCIFVSRLLPTNCTDCSLLLVIQLIFIYIYIVIAEIHIMSRLNYNI